MIGLSARFAEKSEIRARGPIYAKAAKDSFKADLEHVCIENIQACVIIANICLADSDSKAESLYYALAIRMALILDLASTSDVEDGLTRETARRVWWTCFLVDIWSSGGSSISRQLTMADCRPRMPVDELIFFNLRPKDEDITDTEWRPGIWSHMLAMVEVYKEIQDLIRYLVVITEWDEEFIETTVDRLAVRLQACEESFEPEILFSAENLVINADRGLGSYLDQNRPPTLNGNAYADRCKLHARKFCEILKLSREHKQAKALHNIIAHITIVSSAVLLHTYVFGDASELSDTMTRLESNMEALVELRVYWPSVELMVGVVDPLNFIDLMAHQIDRLAVFLKNCVRSTTRNTHRFDKWMVKFLQEYGKTLDEKDKCEVSTSTFPEVYDSGLGQRSRTIQDVMSAYWQVG
ncbi:hypothetical protein V500_08206 [Pseudogymnoascus sp. VKM F-4518 (FW-2643)]|nr:hypothetical protein V500_08206 [Pseudogymnoascus sp. VKM F-4518 (FW-2643)]